MAPGQVPVPSRPHVRLRSSVLQLRLPTTTAPPGADEPSEDGRQVFLPSYPPCPAIVISKLAMKLGHHKYVTTTSLRFCFACMFSRVSRSFRCHFLCGEKDGKVTQERKKADFIASKFSFSPLPQTQPEVEMEVCCTSAVAPQLYDRRTRLFFKFFYYV